MFKYMNKLKALVYVNEEKDPGRVCAAELKKLLINGGATCEIVDENTVPEKGDYDVLFVIGGDGTILRRTEFANRNGIPVVGINAGKLGFLSEFEQSEIAEASKSFIDGELVKDERSTLEIEYKGEKYLGLNDVVIQRIYENVKGTKGMVISATVSIDGDAISPIIGDGVIVCSPTGSTAYSLAVGGAVLAPKINAFSLTPIAAHSFAQRPVVFSADSDCLVRYDGGASAGLFVDGKLVSVLNSGETFKIRKAQNPTIFLRKKSYSFYSNLSCKLKDRAGL